MELQIDRPRSVTRSRTFSHQKLTTVSETNVSDKLAFDTAHLPSNTLLVTLSPPGKVFYLFQKTYTTSTRPPTPSLGYNSDPESGPRNIRIFGDNFSDPDLPESSDVSSERLFRIRKRRGGLATADAPAGEARSAGWQDLLKYESFQQHVTSDTQVP
jgi:UV radiation resistance-associated gene protein